MKNYPAETFKISKHFLLGLLVFFMCINEAQTTFAQTNTSFNEVIKVQWVKDWQRAKAYTNEFLKAMPADKYSYKPEKDAMTFAAQMLHLAKYNYNLGAAATGAVNPYAKRDLQKEAAQMPADSVNYYVNASYDFVIESLNRLDAAKLNEQPGGKGLPRFLTLEKAFEHQTHHRGTMALYLRMAGIVPPHEMLF